MILAGDPCMLGAFLELGAFLDSAPQRLLLLTTNLGLDPHPDPHPHMLRRSLLDAELGCPGCAARGHPTGAIVNIGPARGQPTSARSQPTVLLSVAVE